MTNFLIAFLLTAIAPSIGASAKPLAKMSHEELSNELLKRWDQTKLPEFLESKKAQIDEVIETGLKIEIDLLRDILTADADTTTVKNSSLVNPNIYSSLQTQSSSKYILENLKAGKLVPRANPARYSRFGVYLELHLLSNPRPFEWGDVEFHFDYSLLDRTDYHLNPGWAYGNYNPDSASPAVNLGRTNYYLRKFLAAIAGQKNEVVFHNAVPFTSLVGIYVPKGKKQNLLTEITKLKLICPVSIGWDKLISEK